MTFPTGRFSLCVCVCLRASVELLKRNFVGYFLPAKGKSVTLMCFVTATEGLPHKFGEQNGPTRILLTRTSPG